ncbi:NERD domain-containing protein [Deinococcus radiotolerans]|uniref:NERD domain-containing protein n=1 Tax=Deinococcus radiotolerans TaxID=1309407 RepID=A0ABQ2FG05_9DEIO|nr:NERD domain-containing protein [Deinococcus radiotolerans]GGK85702.1 hypothetical protein GCM10010844_00270 [Deinococcus radiotolerans]
MFVGQSFLIGDVAEPIIPVLEAFLTSHPDAIALLEFTSPGLQRRQLDCALISAGGIDLIEVKNKHGVVTGTAAGEWLVRRGRFTDPVVNFKAGRAENPYQQAYNASRDLQAGLKRLGLGGNVRVTPMVWLPSADPSSSVAEDFNVGLLLGTEGFVDALKSAPRSHGGRWDGADPRVLPTRLGLQPMNLSFLRGRVVAAHDHQGVADVEVWAEVNEERHTTRTDEQGVYTLAVALGADVTVGFSPPERYVLPATASICADLRYVTVSEVRLADRFPRKTEEELRREVMREVESRVQQRLAATQAHWEQARAEIDLVVDDLTAQLRTAQLRLVDQERLLRDREAQLDQPRLPLPAQVRQAHSLRVVQEQRGQIDEALELLRVPPYAHQRDDVDHVLRLLSKLEWSARRELTDAAPELVPAVRLTTAPRAAPTLPADSPFVDVPFREVPDTPPVGIADVRAGRRIPWGPVMVAALLAAGAGGAMVAWMSQTRPASQTTTPAPVTLPAVTVPPAAGAASPETPVAAPAVVTPPSPSARPAAVPEVALPEVDAAPPTAAPSSAVAPREAPRTAPVETAAPVRPVSPPPVVQEEAAMPPSASSRQPTRPATAAPVSSPPPVSPPKPAPAAPPTPAPAARSSASSAPAAASPEPTADATDLPGEVVTPSSAAPAEFSPDEPLPGVPVE